jgi:hypothetical protein
LVAGRWTSRLRRVVHSPGWRSLGVHRCSGGCEGTYRVSAPRRSGRADPGYRSSTGPSAPWPQGAGPARGRHGPGWPSPPGWLWWRCVRRCRAGWSARPWPLALLREAPTSSASISVTDRLSPSGVSPAALSEPAGDMTRSPLARESARCSAWPRQTLTLRKLVSPSRHWPSCWIRWVTATRRLVTAMPLLVKRSSGPRPGCRRWWCGCPLWRWGRPSTAART